MNVILLSGGSGKRLWPLSNDVRSKQFIKIFKNCDGEYVSMVQRMYCGIKKAAPNAKVTIATSESQVASIKNQLGDAVAISKEPCRKDTFPTIALAANFLLDVQKVSREEPVVVCPVDPFVDESYFESLVKLAEIAEKSNAGLTLLGIEPDCPSEKYGYIIPEDKNIISKVLTFKEKPSIKVAEDYIAKGALWNGGIFAFKLGYLIDKAHEYIDYKNYDDMFSKYENLQKISFDYAVVEKEPNIQVLRYSGKWKDLGTWNSLTESIEENVIGNAVLDETCENVHVLNELDSPIICVGLKDVIISANVEGVLVADKNQSCYIKPLVDTLHGEAKFAEKSWGEYKVIDASDECLTVKITVRAGHSMNYHTHNFRNEIWNIVSGEAVVVIDDERKNVKAGDVITLKAGQKHTIIAKTDVKLLEVQLGKDISAKDKIKCQIKKQ